mmetsp:Transcript_23039/g.32457  ORF Transcript_23039/g.32457 Transcript_23039/m.32457 type:complete len:736 (+) Transcript_23039:369-2576(+)
MSNQDQTTTTNETNNGTTKSIQHVTESISDRKKSRELQQARQSGTAAPEVDVKTGAMINPHNPEFITKRPWYLGGGEDHGPSLDHQADQRTESEKLELSVSNADKLVRMQREERRLARNANRFKVGMWAESLKKGRRPYMICQIVKIGKNGTIFDLKYDDGTMERNVKMKKEDRGKKHARIRLTSSGARTMEIDHEKYGKETYDSKRDSYHGFEIDKNHIKWMEEKFATRDALRRKMRTNEREQSGNHAENRIASGTNSNNHNHQNSNNNKHNSHSSNKTHNNESNSDGSDSDSDYDSDAGSDSEDEFVQRDEDAKVHVSRLARQGGVGGQQMKVTARNLRIREDTAKYLWNLDINSAYYDPKSRSMRDNPNPSADPTEVQFAGDNFARISGDAIQLAQTQVFAWDGGEHTNQKNNNNTDKDNDKDTNASNDIHPQANPSMAELERKKFQSKSINLKEQRKKTVLDKYGGAEYLDGSQGLGGATNNTNSSSTSTSHTPHDLNDNNTARAEAERRVRFGVSVQEEHYARDGRILSSKTNGADPNSSKQRVYADLTSKYEEDIFLNGHTTVWGSYFHKGAFRWGYADDHSLMRNSYNTGTNGRLANDEANELQYGTGVAGSAAIAQARQMLKAIPRQNKDSEDNNALRHPTNSNLYGEANPKAKLDTRAVRQAMKRQMEEELEQEQQQGKSKRKYNSLNVNVDVTEEDMEAYRMRKERVDDPMAKLASSGELLEYKQ